MMIRSAACSDLVRTSSSVFKLNKTCFVESSLGMRHGFEYDAETKRQSCQWKPRPKKARQSKSKVKVILITFFFFVSDLSVIRPSALHQQ